MNTYTHSLPLFRANRIAVIMSIIILGIIAVLGSFMPAIVSGQSDVDVVVVTIDSEITAGTLALIERAIAVAQDRNASHFIVELNTPGGLLQATERISRVMIDSSVTTVVFVHKESGWAFSAGTFILLSADVAASTPTASIGAAQPVGGGGETLDDKVVNASAAWIESLAERTDRDSTFVREFVTESRTVTGAQAHEEGLVDILANDREELLSELGLIDPVVLEVSPNIVDNILGFLSLPYLVPLLLSLGVLGIFFMFRTGEIESLGVVGVLFLLLGLWGMGAIQLSALGVILVVAGVGLLIIELTISPGFGIVGTVGAISLLFGIVTFANEPFFPSYHTQTLFYLIMGVGAGIAAIMMLLGHLSVKAMLTPVKVGREAIYGQEFDVAEALDPMGAVIVGGERYPARTLDGSSVPAGERVKVVRMEGNTILVERIITNNS
jgi:membrane-bound serine protease (ClpP class)